MATVTRYRPSRPAPSLRRELDRFLNNLFPATEASLAAWRPTLDLADQNGEYVLMVDLPGVSQEDLSIRMEDNRLIISGERRTVKKEEADRFLRMERAYGRFYRAVTLPEPVKASAITAEFNAGVLTVYVPKAA